MIAPPFIITEEQIDECVGILKETMDESLDRYLAD
jgi:adenosylmethionine-8-amino-7-oxononanoate aminotransferase